jgi:hypothetical protein
MGAEPNSRVVNFSQGMPEGYRVEYDPGHEMYWWVRLHPYRVDGPYADRFRARRGAIAHSKQPVQ